MENDNKLIAEFMGWTEDMDSITHEGDKWWSSPDTHKYHTSWDWLMSAVTECHKVIENYGYDDDTRNYIDDEIFNLDNTLSEFFNDDKEAIYNRVIEFIKFYNKNK